MLVTLGQGAEVRAANQRALDLLAAREDVQVAALSSALAAVDSVPDGVVQLRATYPMSLYFRAFDAAIAAAGYNAYHELIALGVPSLFVAMPRDTDDQPARARHAAAAGIGLGVEGPDDPALEAELERLLDPDRRAAIAARLAELPEPSGAADAAIWLSERPGATGSGRRTAGADTAPGREFRRRWGSFLASAPRTAYRLTRQQLSKPRARALVLAVGIADEQVAGAVARAVASADEDPERTLVVTDSLAALARAARARGRGRARPRAGLAPGRARRDPL